MKEQYSEILKRHEKELEDLAGTRFVDIEKLQKMSRPFEEIKEVHARYQKEQEQMIVRHGKEKAAFLKVNEQNHDMTDIAADMLKKHREKQQNRREQDRGRGGYEV